MTRGLQPPRPDSELSKLKTRVFNLERILRGLRSAKPGMLDVPSISAWTDDPGTFSSGTERAWISLADQTRTQSFETKGRLTDGGIVILESALYAVTWSVSFAPSTAGARGAEVARISPGFDGWNVLTGEGPVDAEASGSEPLTLSGATITHLGIGQRVELYVWQTSGGDLATAEVPMPTLGLAWLGPARTFETSGGES